MKLNIEEYKPHKPADFWCSKCDRNAVNSEKPETGKFFVVFGHAWDDKEKNYEGEYHGVMFAVCPECQQ